MEETLNKLFSLLDSLITLNSNKLRKDIKRFEESQSEYRQFSYTKEVCVVLRKERNPQCNKNIGFPFPLCSKKFYVPRNRGTSVRVFLRGEPIRCLQRKQLKDTLAKEIKTKEIRVSSFKKFKELAKKIANKYSECVHVDPYTFIGDSFIGLYFSEKISEKFNLKVRSIYSNAYTHLPSKYCAKEYTPEALKEQHRLIIIPDLVDSHWEKTVRTIRTLVKRDNAFFVIGRNLIVTTDAKECLLYHFAREDHLLRNENIEDYMVACLLPYVGAIKSTIGEANRQTLNYANLVINPFGSEEIKTIPVNLIESILKGYLTNTKN